ncbi:universal stress protein [Propionibacterium sp.]|uniref:universal stress protein n=1 Tax=Propionibacterium sp. TaxID=1977903 RepID=UPI0039E9F5A7
MSYQQILVGIDGSEQADRAFDKACDLAKTMSAKVHVVQIFDRDRLVPSLYGGDVHFFEEETDRAKKVIETYVAKGKERGADIDGRVFTGSANYMLARHLPDKYAADLIVMGSTGLSTIERLLLGSRSTYVLRNAPCDVLIVK